MTFVKILLVALALWMPAASFASAVGADLHVENEAPCSEHEAEDNDLFLTSSAAPFAPAFAHLVSHDSHSALDGPVAELDGPPPKPSSH